MPKTILPQEVATVNDLDQKKVAEHNQLIAAVAKMSPTSMKLFEIAVAAIDSQASPAQRRVAIAKDDIFTLLGVTSNHRNARLTQALKDLADQSGVMMRTLSKSGGVVDTYLRLVTKAVNAHDQDRVEITFHEDILPYITELNRDFTQYKLTDVTNLKNRHSITLYKLLISYYNQFEYYLRKGERNPARLAELQSPVLPLEDIKHLTDTTERYTTFNDFNRYVLKPAIKEVGQKTSLTITYDKIRVGRRIGKVQFHIDRKEAPQAITTADQQTVKAPSGQGTNADATTVISNPYAGLLITAQLLDPGKVMAEEGYRSALATRLFPAYDRFVKGHDFATLQKHVAYVGTHTTATPTNLVPYMLEALDKYEGQLAKADQQAPRQRKGKVTEKLPKWAEKTDAGERTEGPASEEQIQDSLDKLAELRKNRHHE